jgi:hypothetical protein
VHSPRAKRLFVTRLCERRGVTTMAPLLQVALPGCRDVFALVRFGNAIDAGLLASCVQDETIAVHLRASALELLTAATSPASLDGDSASSMRRAWPINRSSSADRLAK